MFKKKTQKNTKKHKKTQKNAKNAKKRKKTQKTQKNAKNAKNKRWNGKEKTGARGNRGSELLHWEGLTTHRSRENQITKKGKRGGHGLKCDSVSECAWRRGAK